MDDFFANFLKEFGPAISSKNVPSASIERYRSKLPDQLLSYWQEHGWSGFAHGLFWIVDPHEYEPVVDAWLGDTPFMEEDAYHLFARSAFGDLHFFGERSGRKLHVVAPDAQMMPPRKGMADLNLSIRAFFGSRSRRAAEFSRQEGPLFEPARQKLGDLSHDEMYGFVPALALGGTATLAHLQKVKAVEHLVMLAQLAPLRVLST